MTIYGLCGTLQAESGDFNMANIKPKRPRDFNQLAVAVVKAATEGEVAPVEKPKNPHAVALGKLGGLKGGKARAKKLSAKKRSEIAKKAAKTRWKSQSSS